MRFECNGEQFLSPHVIQAVTAGQVEFMVGCYQNFAARASLTLTLAELEYAAKLIRSVTPAETPDELDDTPGAILPNGITVTAGEPEADPAILLTPELGEAGA